jgi:PTS system mannitol-specific IIC component
MENNNTGFRAKIQKFGGVLSGMVMPNIGAFITWGLITAIFLQTGWHPNAHIAKLISPMLSYLLPILIGYTGGKNFYGDRGGSDHGRDRRSRHPYVYGSYDHGTGGSIMYETGR